MRKNKLIELLQNIKGNPDIVLWNGIVGDYQNIDPNFIEGILVKKTLNGYLEQCRLEEGAKRRDWEFKFSDIELESLKTRYKKIFSWEDNHWVFTEDIEKKRYVKKRVVYIQPKLRNKSRFERCGSIEY